MDEETLISHITNVVMDHIAWVMEEDGRTVGMMGGVLSSMMFDKHVKCFIETTWYVQPAFRRHGLKMLKTAEKFCVDLKIDKMIIGHMGVVDREKYEKVFGRKGFELYEQHYIKELSHEKC